MPETFWIEEYRKKAALTEAIAQSGRGNNFNSVDFLYLAKQVVDLLKLRPDHTLLDVGCANGLFDIMLSACCRSILAVEPVADLRAWPGKIWQAARTCAWRLATAPACPRQMRHSIGC